MASFPNIYTHRKVADTAAKPCTICYKPSSSVMVTAENKDFFYVCTSHLKDKQFATPIIDEAAIAAKKKKELEAEVELVKKEFEEKQKKKKEKEKEKEKEKDKKDTDKDEKKDVKKDETKSEDKSKADEAAPVEPEEEPRVFALKKTFYQQRLDKKRAAEVAKRNRERLQNPNLFPQVPKGLP